MVSNWGGVIIRELCEYGQVLLMCCCSVERKEAGFLGECQTLYFSFCGLRSEHFCEILMS